jgi:hypothetical protein
MTIISLLVFLIIIGLLFWAVRALSAAFSIPAPISTVIQVVLVVICVLWLLQMFGLVGGALTEPIRLR